ncbi:MerR family transcriptional regulator [Lacticaseibacillus sharpeae]|uniref:MerR family transcriptional regulator n=1 Tax=Lacticaseibacillus sharpeae TaxID=1626 RepID=UPI000AC8433A|nr:MerR family transcriptional regulator [Lacticaseibacillus sharpeae]
MGLDTTHLLKKLDLSIGIGEASRVSGATLTQIRYWEKKGLLTSFHHSDGRNKRYSIQNIIAMTAIKQMLDDGYTLAKAAETVRARQHTADRLRLIMHEQLKSAEIDEDGISCFNFGAIENDPDYDLIVTASDTKTHLTKVKRQD